jgi:hypothetical protein
MASYKDYKTIAAAKKAGSMYYMNKQGKKMLAVTKEDLDAWKKRNKGKYKGSALTAWANNKGKDISGAPTSSKKPRIRPGSAATDVMTDAEKKEVKEANKEMSVRDIKNVAESALTRAEAARRTYEYNKKQRQSERPKGGGQKFREWYEKNGSKYDTMNEAMAAFKKSLKSGNSKGGLQKKKKGYAKGGMIDYRKTGMFYGGGMTRRGRR